MTIRKDKLLYASPFLPMKSGISDYSETLVYGLKEFFDVSILIDDYKLGNKALYGDFDVLVYGRNSIDFSGYSCKLYNIGNNPYFHSYIYDCAVNHPGMVILHDFVLYFLTVGYYFGKGNLYSKLFEIGGPQCISELKDALKSGKNLLECKDLAESLPLNREILNSAQHCFVHSEYTRKMVLDAFPAASVSKINMVNMGKPLNLSNTNYLREKYGILDSSFVIGSFGYVAPTKLNHLICEAVKELADKHNCDIYYIMAGDGDYADRYLDKRIIRTGYVDRDVYDSILARSDIVSNLRYPSMGETSITLIHAMSLGKPCLVTDHAWFAELPDEVVIKTGGSDIKRDLREKIEYFMHNRNKLAAKARVIKDYVAANHSNTATAGAIYECISGNRGHVKCN